MAESEDCEIVVERRHSQDSEATHDSEAGSIDQREILIRIPSPDVPGGFQIRSPDDFDPGDPGPQAFPEFLGCIAVDAISNQAPRFRQDMSVVTRLSPEDRISFARAFERSE